MEYKFFKYNFTLQIPPAKKLFITSITGQSVHLCQHSRLGHFLGVLRDVVERDRVEQELRNADADHPEGEVGRLARDEQQLLQKAVETSGH